jgi:hypothetical protein
MKISLFLLTFLISNLIYAQNKELEQLYKKKHDYEIAKNKIIDSIKIIDIRINYLKNLDNNEFKTDSNFTITKTKIEAKIKDKPDVFGNIIGLLPPQTEIKIYSFHNGYWFLEADSLKGYANEVFLVENQFMIKAKNNSQKSMIATRFGKEIAYKISKGEIWLGMSNEMAILSIGIPLKVNKDVYSWGTHEQWIYNRRYLYFENNILKSWQDR